MNEIKVTVTYEKPTTSKFDALMAEYEAAKKYADETVSYYKPLADVAEEAKMLAILEQIEPIKQYAKQLGEMKSCGYADVKAIICETRFKYEFVVCYSVTGWYKITWHNTIFNHENLRNFRHVFTEHSYNILGMWDVWKVYQRLEENAMEQLRHEINEQKRKANAQKNRLNNITKGGN